jgi:hypothetical protein
MSDNSATAVYHGSGITTGAWRVPADGRGNPAAEDRDLTDQDHEVRLEGLTGQNEFTASGGDGMHKGDRVPNLSVTKVSRPNAVHALPDSHRTNQNPLHVRQPSQAPARRHGSAGETRGSSRGR